MFIFQDVKITPTFIVQFEFLFGCIFWLFIPSGFAQWLLFWTSSQQIPIVLIFTDYVHILTNCLISYFFIFWFPLNVSRTVDKNENYSFERIWNMIVLYWTFLALEHTTRVKGRIQIAPSFFKEKKVIRKKEKKRGKCVLLTHCTT